MNSLKLLNKFLKENKIIAERYAITFREIKKDLERLAKNGQKNICDKGNK